MVCGRAYDFPLDLCSIDVSSVAGKISQIALDDTCKRGSRMSRGYTGLPRIFFYVRAAEDYEKSGSQRSV